MGNSIVDNKNQLATIDYHNIYEIMCSRVEELKIVTNKKYVSFNNLEVLSNKIVAEIINKGDLLEFLKIDKEQKISCISINFSDKKEFSNDTFKLRELISKKLEKENINLDIDSLESFKGEKKDNKNFGTKYDFKGEKLTKKKLSFNKKENLNEKMRLDLVQIDIKIKDIESKLKNSLINYIEKNYYDEELKEDFIEDVEKGKKGVNDIIHLLNDKSLARIRRSVSYLYLDFLLCNIKENKDLKLLKNYIDRFNKLDQYLGDMCTNTEYSDKDFIIRLGQDEFNILDIFSAGDAFKDLPLIGMLDWTLLEDRSVEEKTFRFGLKLKLNGVIEKEGKNSFQYRIDKLNRASKDDEFYSRNKKSVLRILLLYIFMFTKLDDENFDIKDFLKAKIKVINSSEVDFRKVISSFCKYIEQPNKQNVKLTENIKSLENMLKKVVNYKHNALKKPIKEYTKNLVLYKSILNDNLEDEKLFVDIKNEELSDYKTDYLKHVSIVDDENLSCDNYVLSMPINIRFESKALYDSSESEDINLEYSLDKIKNLPVIIMPTSEDKKNDNFKNLNKHIDDFKEKAFLVFPYNSDKKQEKSKALNYNLKDIGTKKTYLYNIIYTTYLYIIIDVLLEKCNVENKKDIFISFLRIYFENCSEESYSYIRRMSKTLEHMFSIDYRASSQGFDTSKNKNYIYKNAISSLYNKVPKKFEVKDDFKINKFAMVVVTSRKCDSVYDVETFKSSLIGEVILFDKLDNKTILCDSFKTFCDNYNDKDLFENPIVLNDLVNELSNKGYKEIVYISKAPFTSRLNITNDKENLYFMNEKIIGMMKSIKNVMIYPMFYQDYYVVDNSNNNNSEALYIDDTREIDENINKSKLNKSISGVFNLYSGKFVGNNKIYKKVILYSTFNEMYNDTVLNAKLQKIFLNNSDEKKDIVNFITLLHYSRYEANKNISIKVDPYKKLIGDEGVGALAVSSHLIPIEISKRNKKINFNSLAYLTEVKKSIDKYKVRNKDKEIGDKN